jgi:chemotaxis protein MotB
MAVLARRRRFDGGADYWPGFVDAMATLLLVIMFLLTVFMLAQFLLANEISGRDTALNELRSQVAELNDLLALERADARSLQASLAGLSDDLTAAESERSRLSSLLTEAAAGRSEAEQRIVILQDELEREASGRQSALAELEERQRVVVDLRSEVERSQSRIASLTKERDAAEAQAAEASALAAERETIIVDLRTEAEKEQALAVARLAALDTARAEIEASATRISDLEADVARGLNEAEAARQRIEVLTGSLEYSDAERQQALAALAAAQDQIIFIQSEQDLAIKALRGELVSATERADEAEARLEETAEQTQLIIDLRREQEQGAQRIARLSGSLSSAESERDEALQDIEFLSAQLAALRRQIGALQLALDASEERDIEQQAQISDLGRRLNVALAQKVKELSRYRSEFFGKLRQILSNRSDIRVVGDRFVFQSEVLFPSASALINDAGRAELDKLAEAIVELEQEIPEELNWVLRVDGHTDKRAISSFQFRSNWELSSARAISVVRYLIDRGVPPKRLVAAGFGEFQPLDGEENDEAYSRNRRIELKLTER